MYGVFHQGAGMEVVTSVLASLNGHSTNISTTGGIVGRIPGIVGFGTCAHAVLPTVSTAMPIAAIHPLFMISLLLYNAA
jgi:hypothetical protein